MTPEQLAEGRRLLEAATSGPWIADEVPPESQRAMIEGGPAFLRTVAVRVPLPDAALIVWLRNHAEELLAAQEERDRLRGALEQHKQREARLAYWQLGDGHRARLREDMRRVQGHDFAANVDARVEAIECEAIRGFVSRAALGDSA